MPMTEGCYLCGGSEFRQRKGEVRDNPALQILECVGCGLVFLDSHDHISPGHYENAGMHPNESIEAWRRMAEPDDQRRVEMLQWLIVDRRVLDVGCGAGGFLHKAKPLASEVAGVEPEARAREAYGDLITLYPDVESVVGCEYDLITAFHVIEHLPNPRAMLTALRHLLAPRGRLVVEVPSSDDALLTLYNC